MMPQPVEFACDLNGASSTLSHRWEHTVGSGRATLALRADWQEQLRRCRSELGVRHVRFHGMLMDDMGTLIEYDGKPLYSFFNIDQIIDFLLSIGMKPFMELSFMPAMLASGDKTVFHYRGNVTPPADYNAWSTLVSKLVSHLVARYGVEEVREWYFEVWNEPNLPDFWDGTQNDYFRLYQHTATAIKDVDASLRVGGPATAMTEWIAPFTAFCRKESVPLDFISTHIYPTDPLGFEGTDTEEQLSKSPRHLLRDRAELVQQQADGLPVYFTEWNVTSNPRDEYHDTSFAAAYVARTVLETDTFVNSFSFWTFTDIFEENSFPSIPFHGGFGLLNLHGIPKPMYRAFQLLHALGTESLQVRGAHDTLQLWVVQKHESCTVFMVNHAQPRQEISTQIVRVRLNGRRDPLMAYVQRIDEEHANPRKTWQDMGSPEYLSALQVRELMISSELQKEFLALTVADDGIEFAIDVPPNAVASVTIEFGPSSPSPGKCERPSAIA